MRTAKSLSDRLNDLTPARRVGRRWVFADGTTLPVVAGGADDDAGDGQPPATEGEASATSSLTDEDLQAREDELLAEAEALPEDGDNLEKLTAIADELAAIQAEKESRKQAKAEAAAKAKEQRDRIAAAKAAREAEASDDGDDDDDDDGDDPGDGDDPDDKGGEGAKSTADDKEPALTASGKKIRKPSAKRVAGQAQRPAVETTTEKPIVLTASAGVGFEAGAEISLDDVAFAMHKQVTAMSNGMPRVSVVTVNLPDAEYVIGERSSNDDALDLIKKACDTNRLDLTTLTAAGGWCTPSENMYELFGLDGATGLFTAPRVTIRRGGINVPGYIGIDSADGAIWSWSEDQDAGNVASIINKALTANVATLQTDDPHAFIVGQTVVVSGVGSPFDGVYTITAVTADTFSYARTAANVASAAVAPPGTAVGQKACFRIPCPTWTDFRLGALGWCFEHGNMTDRSFPELGRRYLELVVNAHLHAMSAAQVATIIASHSAPLVTIPAGDSDAYGDLMAALELQILDYRSEHGIADTVVLEVLMPVWTLGALRSSLAKRQGVDLLSVTDQQLAAHFAVRSVRPQFLEDYQPMYDGAPATAWPADVDFIMYPAGSAFIGDGGKIELGAMRDSTLNATNDFTLAWTEQFWLLGWRGPLARRVRVPLDVSGITGCCPAA